MPIIGFTGTAIRDKRMDGRATSPEELILIRVGHHLWRSRKRKEWPEEAIVPSLQAVWAIKEALRVDLRRSWLEYVEKRNSRLAPTRKKKA